jgi:hypothetical protein
MMRFQRDRTQKVPILGVEGVGKSSVLFTLTHFVSENDFGCLVDDPDQIMALALPLVMRGEPLPATMKGSRLRWTITRIPQAPPEEAQINVQLTSNDIPGIAFRQLLDHVHKHPNDIAGTKVPELGMFCTLLKGCSGLLIVVDLIRDLTLNEFNLDIGGSLNTAFSDQVGPMMASIDLAARVNGGHLANMPVYFVFTKGDLHRLPSERIDAFFKRANAIQLQRLKRLGASVKTYHVKAAGWWNDSNLEHLGFSRLLTDLMFALRTDKK